MDSSSSPHPPPARRVVHADGRDLAVVEVGAPDAPTVLVAHGAGSSARFVVAAFAAPVVASGRRLVAFDLRGHADSSPAREVADHVLDGHVDDLAAVAASLPTPPAVVAGVSLGGHAALRAVASGRVGAAAVGAALPAWLGRARPGVGPHAAIAAGIRTDGVAGLLARLRADNALPGWLRDALVTDYARHDEASLAAALLALDGAEAPDRDDLAALTVPLGVVGWPDDPGHPLDVADAWVATAPRAALFTLHLQDLDGGLDRLGAALLAAVDAASPPMHGPGGWS